MASILLNQSLQTYFFEELESINNKSHRPIPVDMIHYSSNVLDKFSQSEEYFEMTEGRPQEKILGIKLLESGNLPTSKQIETLRDIGDTALCLCGFFAKSVNKKLLNITYYHGLGKMAYSRLNSHIKLYDDPRFYLRLSNVFDELTLMIKAINNLHNESLIEEMILNCDESDDHVYATLGIHKAKKIAS